MSGINGDKARFHRRRKQKIQRRMQQKEMFGALLGKASPAAPRADAKSKEKSA